MAAKILLLEDDFILSEIICEFLVESGFNVTHCDNANDALNLAYEKQFDIWLLDVKVPSDNEFGNNFIESSNLPGFELLKTLRETNKTTPCIFITSLSSLQDVQSGYGVGCDDFLKKPFELLELKLRIETLLKRVFKSRLDEFEDFGNGLKFYFVSKILYQDDKKIPLTQKESLLLNLLVQNANSYVSQSVIFDELWELDQEPSELSLRAYIKNIRKIIGKDKILNSHNKGYCYVK
ncbi:response regulator transcription factor [Helicobacter sp. MIT 99-5507]|uniref:response regulator transcription factor n=1 Tax=Helicobacter sp. MIT 99-5507 TaxID=152489 RepID=UPI000E1EA29B|nr:response regulator transcription factor [Helicobacter sp. MIT 99-5507]RDU58300.1 two-component system response regulator [Helicobacter sp. MIT 99-5507]